MQFLDLLYKETGYFGEMCIIKYPTYWKQHAIIKIGDVYLEPQIYGLTYDLEDISILFTYTYEELLFVATYIRAIEQ